MTSDERLDLVEKSFVCKQRVHGSAYYDKYPTMQAERLDIYQMEARLVPCDIFPMSASPDKKAEAERSAREIYQRLMALERPTGLSNNQWTTAAGVSTSFFTNMQGETKPASNPSVHNLRLILKQVGVTLPEFFLDEARGRIAQVPTKRELEQALADVWEGLPKDKSKQITFVAENVLRALRLPQSALTSEGGASNDERAALAE